MLKYRDYEVSIIREYFADALLRRQFVVDKTGCKMLELVGACFEADEPLIFGAVNQEYVDREIEWYTSASRNVNDIPGGPPAIWKAVSGKDPGYEGMINSNYGWMLFHPDNYHQYAKVVTELKKNEFSRRALAIYNRPTMHEDYNVGGMSDFVCTNAVQYLVRDGYLDTVVQMRSNDIWAGYRNDRAWQLHVRDMLINDLRTDQYSEALIPGHVTWQVGSLHCYEKDFYLVDNFVKTGEVSITKAEYKERYPKSEWVK